MPSRFAVPSAALTGCARYGVLIARRRDEERHFRLRTKEPMRGGSISPDFLINKNPMGRGPSAPRCERYFDPHPWQAEPTPLMRAGGRHGLARSLPLAETPDGHRRQGFRSLERAYGARSGMFGVLPGSWSRPNRFAQADRQWPSRLPFLVCLWLPTSNFPRRLS